MRSVREIFKDGILGLLIGDALGVPFEFKDPAAVLPFDQIDMKLPGTYRRSYSSIKPGTWSDDGAQALCLLDSLVSQNGFDAQDLTDRLLRWWEQGLWAVDGHIFDIGVQTAAALIFRKEASANQQAPKGLRVRKGNGSLMRILPLALFTFGSNYSLVEYAHAQSEITHPNTTNHVCGALYCLWARYIFLGESVEMSWNKAVNTLQTYYENRPAYLKELQDILKFDKLEGSGYVVDSLMTTKHLLFNYNTYEDVVKQAIALGNDTDTTAAIAGGIAGIAYGNIPERWVNGLRGQGLLDSMWHKIGWACND